MNVDLQWVSQAVAAYAGRGGRALDLGGGRGPLQPLIQSHGFQYVNLDVKPSSHGAVRADAHVMPFPDNTFELVVLKDTLEHFEDPKQVMREVLRVSKPGAALIVWVPFLWPFHGDDYYRYTPLVIPKLLAGFNIVRFESPLWVFSVLAQAIVAAASRLGLGRIETPLKSVAARLDRRLQPRRTEPRAFAATYLIVAEKG